MKFLPIALGAWCAATAFGQIPSDSFNGIRRLDPVAFIPQWKFFAPTPASHDYRLFARGQHGTTGDVSDWVDINPPTYRGPGSIVWNPRKRSEKGVYDVLSVILRAMPYEDEKTVQSLPAYRALAEFARERVRQTSELEPFAHFQFCLVESDGYANKTDPRVIFISGIFEIRSFNSQATGRRPKEEVVETHVP